MTWYYDLIGLIDLLSLTVRPLERAEANAECGRVQANQRCPILGPHHDQAFTKIRSYASIWSRIRTYRMIPSIPYAVDKFVHSQRGCEVILARSTLNIKIYK